jgi:hypothetical protein
MRMKLFLAVCALCIAGIATAARAKDLGALKVLYIGDRGSPREQSFTSFLTQYVARVDSTNRKEFDPAMAAGYDVVMLDWPQDPTLIVRENWGAYVVSPLGPREKWGKPTVLLGSAGLNVGISWQVRGGIGCTCLQPLAYGLRDHEIFDTPFKIDRTKAIRIPTPESFQDEIKEKTIEVLPLVEDATPRYPAGWCTYSTGFLDYPDVEYFCGGVNEKNSDGGRTLATGESFAFWFSAISGRDERKRPEAAVESGGIHQPVQWGSSDCAYPVTVCGAGGKSAKQCCRAISFMEDGME